MESRRDERIWFLFTPCKMQVALSVGICWHLECCFGWFSEEKIIAPSFQSAWCHAFLQAPEDHHASSHLGERARDRHDHASWSSIGGIKSRQPGTWGHMTRLPYKRQQAFDARISIDFSQAQTSPNYRLAPVFSSQGPLTEEDPECPCGLAIVFHSHGFGQVGPPGAEENHIFVWLNVRIGKQNGTSIILNQLDVSFSSLF